jgi:hypothetical protein
MSSPTNGEFEVRGSGPGAMATDSQIVQFANGLGSATFTLSGVPATVTRLSRASLTWAFRPSSSAQATATCTSEHTFYFIDTTSLSPLGGTEGEQLFFELYDWSCRWADGKTGKGPIIAAMWTQFSPIHDPHDSGLMYWRNYTLGVAPAQTVPDAIRCVDPAAGLGQFAVSCKVFDRMFTNGLALHGIQASEVVLTPHAAFTSAGVAYLKPGGWNISNAAAQGNASGPPQWGNHWIADANNGGVWELYDPSYGATRSPWSASPAVGGHITPPAAYEAGAGVTFDATPAAGGATVHFPTANPNDPRLDGTINFAN